MMQKIHLLNRGQRIVIFILIFGGGIALIAAIALLLLTFTLNVQPRVMAQAVADGVTVREFAQLPDDDAYPAGVTVREDGMIYTASYDTGVVYEITPEGVVGELPQTREFIGSVTGLTFGDDGMLYVFDRIVENPRSSGGLIWRFLPGDTPQEWGFIEDETGFVSPEDVLAVPGDAVYVADRGRREVWRFGADGIGTLFWRVGSNEPDAELVRPTGLAYDSANNALIITDSGLNRLYRVSLDGADAEMIYEHTRADATPDFTGVAVGTDGVLYVAALGGGVVAIRPDADVPFETLAINFRGARDVAYHDGRLYVTNFDSASLVNPLIEPQLPFALDVIEFE